MDNYNTRIPAALARYFRKIGGGNMSEGLRMIGEAHMMGFSERRLGAKDRRRKRK